MIYTKSFKKVIEYLESRPCYKKFLKVDCTKKITSNSPYIIKGNLYVLAQNKNLPEEIRKNCYHMGAILDQLMHDDRCRKYL